MPRILGLGIPAPVSSASAHHRCSVVSTTHHASSVSPPVSTHHGSHHVSHHAYSIVSAASAIVSALGWGGCARIGVRLRLSVGCVRECRSNQDYDCQGERDRGYSFHILFHLLSPTPEITGGGVWRFAETKPFQRLKPFQTVTVSYHKRVYVSSSGVERRSRGSSMECPR
jgi:hypothetical protein